ncbi:PTI1-like tyrosine-protein kinase 2 [Glycine soja]|uniref:Putative proline-rich receptor-like protein kinase PERK11 isoform A n=1 Tax=Glycine soja TaxID=3848 RepID=A0A445HJX0_GLYSO|nr:PTI1-like tyrosine-protein kinase 2 [Glycine soja]KHN25469.1 Putative proline-rich receptor-like protein kinase PERK11 [Glycine soja]RZB74056.1 putative proline-rich receptor-like protein kinase PERK11 isoform A [Glycine soja]RZB74057.1 putative proline-rich receptor-like protein kinase PERK11 isoform B [Glycine soja]RZB74058.1 putative proline-rich receptor-like protein kinase PERK11 isoform C [Glycine soja]
MTVEKRIVLVGIRIDGYSRQLLNWALAKVAEPGDCVIAVHVVKSSDYVSKNKTLIDGYLEVYEGLCGVKKVGLTGQIFTGSSIKNILVREAKKHAALALVLGGRAATAKYCAKRLQPTTNVLAIQDSRIVFRSCTNKQLPGGLILDPRPSLTIIKENLRDRAIHSSICDSIVEIEESTLKNSLESKEEAFNGSEKSKSRSISMFAGDSAEQKLGWPLLRRANSGMSQTLHTRDMSVVQWVMTLPDRSPNKGSSSSSTEENPFERSISDIEYESSSNSSPSSVDIPNGLEEMLNLNSLNCKRFSLEVLKSCTSQFSSEKLVGKGGSNRVYKGVLTDGKSIAVKVMQSSKEAWKDFALEVEIISSLEHKSIAPLLGICIENNTLISVYDYFPNGSLEENLHGKNKDESILSWEVRFNVAIRIAEALDYLHREALKPVIHKDVKSSNILLSQGFEPQLSDFGLAVWGPTTSSFLTQDVVGTFGYLAPEYFMYGKVSDKIDVYAFGVVLLELISGREPINSAACKGQESLVVWAKPIIESGNVKGLLDPNLEGKFDEAQLQRMVLAASLCITRAARLRPKLSQILKILKGEEKVEYFLNSQGDNDQEDSENQENIDDEVYPNSSAELHLSLALLGVDDDSTSHSSTDHSYSEDLKEQWSRSSSFN